MGKLTRKQRRIARLARKCGISGFVSDDLAKAWDLIMLAELPEKDLDRLEEHLNDLELLLEGLRSPN